MRAKSLLTGPPGHPLHPPFTDVAIGAYAAATLCGVLGALDVSQDAMTSVWWIALLVGLGATLPAAATGLVDWLEITRGTPLWRTATLHLGVVVSAASLFGLAAGFGHGRYAEGTVGGAPLGLTLAAFVLLLAGGWLGGTIVFVHGMRVRGEPEEPTREAISPAPPREPARR